MKTQRVLIFAGCVLCRLTLCEAQVVQLPSIHQFSVDTTVSVPDYGGAYLGGVSSSSQGRTERGTPGLGRFGGNRAIGSATGATGLSVRATIIDHAELDDRVLAEAKARRGFVLAAEPVHDLPTPATRETTRVSSLASIRQELAEEDARQEAAAAEVFQKAQACEAKMEWRLARTYYQLAAQKSSGIVKAKSQERLLALKTKLGAQ